MTNPSIMDDTLKANVYYQYEISSNSNEPLSTNFFIFFLSEQKKKKERKTILSIISPLENSSAAPRREVDHPSKFQIQKPARNEDRRKRPVSGQSRRKKRREES